MADEDAFRAAIAAAPGDEAPLKVFADWLDERGRADEAERYRRWTWAGVRLRDLVPGLPPEADGLQQRIDRCSERGVRISANYYPIDGLWYAFAKTGPDDIGRRSRCEDLLDAVAGILHKAGRF